MSWDLYVITDETLAGGLSHAEIARFAALGGADIIQLRDKSKTSLELLQTCQEIRKISRDFPIVFIVNDRLDVAIAAGADGVHLGQGDIRPGVARQLAPPGFIIGVSVSDVEEAKSAENEGADYVALSPVFDTLTKTNAGPGHGLDRLREIRSAVMIPVIAIGGISLLNVQDVIRAGAEGVAVISAAVAAPDITQAVRELRSRVITAKERLGR
jgi:thiamine-phosphate pyrophosphorylase